MQVKSLKDLQNLKRDNKLGNFVLIHGNDKEKIRNSEKYIKSLVDNLCELNLVEIEGNSINIGIIKNACETIPVMATIRVVHIKSAGFLLENIDSTSKILLKEILEYAKDIPEYTILLITHLDLIDKTNQILKVASNLGTLVEYKIPSYGKELSAWIEDFLKGNGKSINKSDIFYLASEISNSIDNMEKELQKLVDYTGDRNVIDRSDIDDIIHKTAESNIFKMSDYMFKRNARGALEILDTLVLQGEPYAKIMFMIIRQFRILYSVKLLLGDGINPREIMSKLKIQEFAYKGIVKIISTWDEKDIKLVLNDALSTDYDIKSGRVYPELGLELLILRICK
ncbi:DNA polymerase III subunit delta [Clostridium cylindrosporum]|uniref:DNA polymerase III subunit delta n=1 Tax=Clostridium cylindrosporum DSM 605 TaxID=1121307 RepID=A0A0J8DBG1_CLOCY|nr:DNA polymerase III subunit delta [Clostridium cylindrosporum]KMT21633.1 DNA polymerase III, delta subunit [Clostridium cylindrosporum DSM 605]